MIALRSLVRPCRSLNLGYVKKLSHKEWNVISCVRRNPVFSWHQQPRSVHTDVFTGATASKNSYFYSTEAGLLENVDSQIGEEEQVSTFEAFRARALQKGRVNERQILKLMETLHLNGQSQELVFLLNCCADSLPNLIREKKLKVASEIWQNFAERSHKFSLADVLALLKVHIAAELAVSKSAWWITPEVEKILEHEDALSLLLKSASNCGNLTESARIISKFKELGLSVGEEEFACLIVGEGKAKNYKGVESILETMRSAGLEPGPITHFAMLQAEIENELPVSDTIKNLQAETMGLSEQQMTTIIHGLANTNNKKLLSSILRVFPVDGLSHKIRNMIIQLIHEGRHFFACNIYPLLLTDSKPEELSSMLAFFPSEMVKSNKSTEDILDICISLQSNFPNHNSFIHFAVEESLRNKSKSQLSGELLCHITPIRNHYFWPLIIRSSCMEDMVEVVKSMQSLGLKLDHDTLTFYVFPNLLKYDSAMNIIRHMQTNCQLSIAKQLGPMLHALLNDKEIEDALHLCKLIRTRTIDVRKLMKPLVQTLHETNNIQATAFLLALLVDSKKYQEFDVVGLLLADYCYKCSPQNLKELLSQLAKHKLRISIASYDIISMRSSMKQVGLQHLDMLTDSSYGGVSTFSSMPHPKDMDVNQLETHLIELRSKQMNTRGVLRKLLQAYCRSQNVEKALQIKKELDADKCELSPGILSSLLSMYVNIQDVRSATDTLRQIEEYPRFCIDEHKIIDYCKLKVQTGAKIGEIHATLNSYIQQLQRNRRSPRNLDVRNCTELVEEVKKTFGEDAAQALSTKLSECGLL